MEYGYSRERKLLQIKMRRIMRFGQVVAYLKARFPKTEDHRLRMVSNSYDLSEKRIVFDGDTPDSVRITLSIRQLAHTLSIAALSWDSETAQGSSMCLSKVSRPSTCPSSEKRHEYHEV